MKPKKLKPAAEGTPSKWQPSSINPTKKGFYQIKAGKGDAFENTGKYTWGYWTLFGWSFYAPEEKEKFDPHHVPSFKDCNGYNLLDGDKWRGLV